MDIPNVKTGLRRIATMTPDEVRVCALFGLQQLDAMMTARGHKNPKRATRKLVREIVNRV